MDNGGRVSGKRGGGWDGDGDGDGGVCARGGNMCGWVRG